MIESSPVVVGDVPEQQRPAGRDRGYVLGDNREAVALRLVLGAVGEHGVGIRIVSHARDVSLQSFCVK